MSYDRRKPFDVESLVSVKVDNLSYRTKPDQLKRAFDRFGEIGDVYIPRDPYGHEASRGFGFVRYQDPRDADDAVRAMDGVLFNGREIRVQLARHSRSHRADFGSRTRRDQRRSRSRSRSGSRQRRRRSRSSSRGYRRRSRSRSRDRRRSRSRSHNSRRRDLTRSRSRSANRHRPEENGNNSLHENNSGNTAQVDVNFHDNVTPQIDIPSSHGNGSNVEGEVHQDQNESALMADENNRQPSYVDEAGSDFHLVDQDLIEDTNVEEDCQQDASEEGNEVTDEVTAQADDDQMPVEDIDDEENIDNQVEEIGGDHNDVLDDKVHIDDPTDHFDKNNES